VSACRSCGQPIRWAITRNDRRMPLDPEPHPDGNVQIVAHDDGRDLVSVLVGRARDDCVAAAVPLYRSHFQTCPHADQHRRPRAGVGEAPT
jgi:hypothetical protein